jgi:glycosyltransferase involved in cell wall biosynthesis
MRTVSNELSPPAVSIVVPCYNEQEVLRDSAEKLQYVLWRMIDVRLVSQESAIVFVDDGSRDDTWAIIEELCRSHSVYRGVKLSRNQGHQRALLAGLRTAPGDALISIDADLQDDVGVIEVMVHKFTDGVDIIYGVRKGRQTDTTFKRVTALCYYRLMKWLGVDIIENHADFRLMSRRAVDALTKYSEVNIFLRALVRQLGFSSTVVTYDRLPRLAGESKYPIRKMASFALEGLTSFSMRPLRLIAIAGTVISFFAVGVGIWAIAEATLGNTVPGWASIVAPLTFVGGLQLLSLGVIGEYVGKIYMETKRRPLFEVEKFVGFDPATRPAGLATDVRQTRLL